jgi:hypothetical protein
VKPGRVNAPPANCVPRAIFIVRVSVPALSFLPFWIAFPVFFATMVFSSRFSARVVLLGGHALGVAIAAPIQAGASAIRYVLENK